MFDYKNEAEIRRYQQMLRIEAGRKVLDQINGKTRQIRQDGYINLLNKYGTAQDNSTAYQWEPETPVTDYELTELYQGGSLFAKIIDAPADEAVKNGIDLGVTDEKAREYIEDTLAWLEWDENISTALKWSRLYGGTTPASTSSIPPPTCPRGPDRVASATASWSRSSTTLPVSTGASGCMRAGAWCSATARSLSGPPSHSTGIGGSPSISGSGRNCGRR